MNSLHYRRIGVGCLSALVLSLGAFLLIQALSDSIHLFVTPSGLSDETLSAQQILRLGGVVDEGSYERMGDGLTSSFSVSDDQTCVEVQYTGVLPALFREGQSVVAVGQWNGKQFVASEILAKHDEYYKPKGADHVG